jgi:hypothetical protein
VQNKEGHLVNHTVYVHNHENKRFTMKHCNSFKLDGWKNRGMKDELLDDMKEEYDEEAARE